MTVLDSWCAKRTETVDRQILLGRARLWGLKESDDTCVIVVVVALELAADGIGGVWVGRTAITAMSITMEAQKVNSQENVVEDPPPRCRLAVCCSPNKHPVTETTVSNVNTVPVPGIQNVLDVGVLRFSHFQIW